MFSVSHFFSCLRLVLWHGLVTLSSLRWKLSRIIGLLEIFVFILFTLRVFMSLYCLLFYSLGLPFFVSFSFHHFHLFSHYFIIISQIRSMIFENLSFLTLLISVMNHSNRFLHGSYSFCCLSYIKALIFVYFLFPYHPYFHHYYLSHDFNMRWQKKQ